MKILFFDMEFANGRVPGSIYSLGYVITDADFRILEPQTDLLINPDSTWNEYVEQNILAYPKEQVEAAPKFPILYQNLKELFEGVDVAVGFAVNNDIGALRKNCERYGLEMFCFRYFDTERLCRLIEEHKDARGLSGCVQAWCGTIPENQHRSDGDAYATMMLLREICCRKHVDAEMILTAYPECMGSTDLKQKVGTENKKKDKKRFFKNKKKNFKKNLTI